MFEEKTLAKIMTMKEALAWREEKRKKRQNVVITNGCFDILHRGHATYLMRAREEGDLLLLAINSDRSVQAVKGPSRPINKERDRAFIMACLPFVDAVVIFDTPDCTGLLSELKPDIYVKGGDYNIETINQDERHLLEKMGCRIKLLGHVPGYSTTSIIKKTG